MAPFRLGFPSALASASAIPNYGNKDDFLLSQFLDNGRSGYVLKPDWMRNPPSELPARPGRKLLVHVYSAHMHQGKNVSVFKDDLFVKVGDGHAGIHSHLGKGKEAVGFVR